MDSGQGLARELKVVDVMVEIGCMFDTAAEMVEVHWVREDMAPAGLHTVVGTAGGAGHRRASRQTVSSRPEIVFAVGGEGKLGDDSLWDWRRRTWTVLVGYRRLIVDGGCRDLQMMEPGHQTSCEGHWADTGADAAAMVGLDLRMRMVVGRIVVGIVVLEYG